ncbi:hypothetical protein AXF42_Ash008011 [Apostasia shenzhenica]|uniref:Uncharacterized protein n=1 Tax=Apostasia shenzhenica TaxID=1088818 RepID=A0A2I0A8B1_9ASPA|nr:hypothetical protein AXF42_Ash008011 [Apostasia shenzhenica]
MAAMLLKSRIAFELFPPRANFPSNLSNLCGSSSILPVETLYGFGFPFRWPSGPFLGQHSTVLGCACLGLGGTASDFSKVQAFSAGGAGGDDGFRGRGDGGSGGDGGEEAGGNWSFLTWYLTSLDKHPVATKAITSAALTLAGDLICQLLMDRVPNLDAKRTLVFTFLGLVLVLAANMVALAWNVILSFKAHKEIIVK